MSTRQHNNFKGDILVRSNKMWSGIVGLTVFLVATFGQPSNQQQVEPLSGHQQCSSWAPNCSRRMENIYGRNESQAIQQKEDPLISSITRATSPDELPTMTFSYNPHLPEQLEACDNFFYNHDNLHGRYSLANYGVMALVAKLHSSVYSDAYIHNYDDFADLKRAAGPQVDQELCLRQLEQLTQRAERQEREKYHSRDINFYQLMDSWAHKSPGLLLGNAFLIGQYRECTRLTIKQEDGEQIGTRYCFAKLKHRDWPQLDKHDITSLKAGICLPETCDSSNYKNKFELIMRLANHQLRPVEQNEIYLKSLYCLPDKDSPLHSIRHSYKAMVVLACFSFWLALLLFATYKHHRLTSSATDVDLSAQKRSIGLSTGFRVASGATKRPQAQLTATDCNEAEKVPPVGQSQYLHIYEMLSITNNLKLLFDTSKGSSLMEAGDKLESSQKRDQSDVQLDDSSEKKIEQLSKDLEKQNKIIDLRCIEGVKVLAMMLVIMGHVLMCLPEMITNGREVGGSAFLLMNMVPAFAVNSFFTITGILTCYLMLKQNRSHSFITSPIKWMAFIIYRYLRIMPMYALMILYTKTLAKYAGSGPLWDYGTSSLSQRRVCEREPWLWTLLFGANFLPPLEHCIPSAWYLANDFQFFMLTPIFLALLQRRPTTGQIVLVAGALLGYSAGFLSIATSDIDDLRPIAKFAPYGFKTYTSHFSFNYTQPQYRIPAYLIGLLIGYQLYVFEQDRLRHMANKLLRSQEQAVTQDQCKSADGESEPAATATEEEPGWSEGMKSYTIPVSIFLIFACCITPAVGSMLPLTKSMAKLLVAFITPSYHILVSVAIGGYLMLATTGEGNKLLDGMLSASFWKPFARLSLCTVLINVEVIQWIVQSNPDVHYLTEQFHMAMNLFCIVCTYLIATVVCVVFEAPIRSALNSLLAHAISRVASHSRRHHSKPVDSS